MAHIDPDCNGARRIVTPHTAPTRLDLIAEMLLESGAIGDDPDRDDESEES